MCALLNLFLYMWLWCCAFCNSFIGNLTPMCVSPCPFYDPITILRGGGYPRNTNRPWSKNDTKCAVLKVPTAGTNNWKHSHRWEIAAVVGPMFTPKELYYISGTTLSITVTVSGIHSHSKTSNWIKCKIITHVQGYQCCTEHKCKPSQYSHMQYPTKYQGFAPLLPPLWEESSRLH